MGFPRISRFYKNRENDATGTDGSRHPQRRPATVVFRHPAACALQGVNPCRWDEVDGSSGYRAEVVSAGREALKEKRPASEPGRILGNHFRMVMYPRTRSYSHEGTHA